MIVGRNVSIVSSLKCQGGMNDKLELWRGKSEAKKSLVFTAKGLFLFLLYSSQFAKWSCNTFLERRDQRL